MGKVSEVDVSFRLFHDSLNPAEVTAQLGLTPTAAYAKGEMSPPGPVTGRSYRRRTGMWRLQSPLPRAAERDDHLRALLEQLDAKASRIQAFKDKGVTVDFFCGLFLGDVNEGLGRPPETLARVAALSAMLDLDIYGPPGDDEPGTSEPTPR